jgi:hypothetical protein
MRVRTGLSLDADGNPDISLYDRTSRERLALNLSSAGDPSCVLRHSTGNNPVAFYIDEQGHPRLDMYDRGTKAGMALALRDHSNPSVWLIDTEGIIRTSLSVDPTQSISMDIFDKNGRPRATIGSTRVTNERSGETELLPPSTLLLYDENGKVVFSAPRKPWWVRD